VSVLRIRLAVALAACCFLAACAGTPSKTAKPAPAGADENEIGALYARLGEAVKRYEGSAGLADAGERERAAREGNAALDDLRAAAQRCQQLPGCENERFLSAFDGLLRRDAPIAAVTGEGEKPVGADALPEAPKRPAKVRRWFRTCRKRRARSPCSRGVRLRKSSRSTNRSRPRSKNG
jgi:hypothetical protein